MLRKYMKNCRRLFPVYGKYERQFLKRLGDRINEYMIDYPDLTYDELMEQFGSPKEIVLGYYDSVDDDYLLTKTNLVKNLRIFLIVLVIMIVSFFSYRSYIIYQAYLDAKDTIIIHEETTIEEDEN
ncbi:DUF6120 family protein [Anaerostipes faecis]|uniref:DUF6120 family protein n=1 Tax=Anaerostipes faecis TaxID=2880702 RepID=UPI002658E74A|nr:DUF6120 family protein [Anaerostipes faecis]